MAKLTARQVKELSKHFFSVAQSISHFRESQWDNLTKVQHQMLSRLQWSLYNSTDDLLALSSAMSLDEVQDSLAEIGNATRQANQIIDRTEDLEQVISIATQIIRLVNAVLSRSPLAIVAALADLTNKG